MRSIDPNVIYLLLVFGLWASATIAYMPGTVILEFLAVGALASSLFMFTRRPTNWISVSVLAVGVIGFLAVPLLRRQYSRLALIGLLAQVIGGLTLFPDRPVSIVVVLSTVIISLALYRAVLMPILATQEQAAVIDDEAQLPGMIGRVVRDLTPVGTVNIRGELWTAYATAPIPAGAEVRVLEKEGIRLHVEKIKAKRQPTDPTLDESEELSL